MCSRQAGDWHPTGMFSCVYRIPKTDRQTDMLVMYLEVDVVDGVPDVFAPVADLVLLEAGAPALREAVLAAERLRQRRRLQGEQLGSRLLTPRADDVRRTGSGRTGTGSIGRRRDAAICKTQKCN